MPNRWVTSDHHFHHLNIIKYTARPFAGVDEMDEAMVDLWNRTVRPGDEVWHLGDLYWIRGDNWVSAQELVSRLNGRIHFIKGDHDPGLPQFESFGFGRIFADMKYWDIVDRVLLIHDYDNRHMFFRQFGGTPEQRVTEDGQGEFFDIAFCGHIHRNWLHSNVTRAGGVALNVGVDLWHFRPAAWEVAVEMQKDWLEYCNREGQR